MKPASTSARNDYETTDAVLRGLVEHVRRRPDPARTFAAAYARAKQDALAAGFTFPEAIARARVAAAEAVAERLHGGAAR